MPTKEVKLRARSLPDFSDSLEPLVWLPFELPLAGAARHARPTSTCVERREAFHLAEVPDPTVYAPEAPSVDEMAAAGWKLP